MKILAIDSSSKTASAAILEDHKLLGEIFVDIGLTHSQTLLPLVKSILDNTKLNINDIDTFAISNGPGSFTGIRIGISLIKGLAFPKNKPCIPISTLKALSYNLINCEGIICPVMDAKCNQVYNAIFKIKNNKITRISEDRAISIDDLLNELKKYEDKVFFVGDGSDLCYNRKSNNSNFFIADNSIKYQTAKSIAYLALGNFKNNKFIYADKLYPSYIRLPQAQRLLNKKNEAFDE